MTHPDDRGDVLIAGGGFAGLTLAIALRQALGPSFSVTVADPTLGASHAGDERASAIVAAARRLLDTLGIWQAVAGEAQPILDMVVTDSRLEDAVRPAFLTFAGEVEPGEPFAHMIENRRLIAALEAKAKETGVECRRTAVARFSYPGHEGRRAPPTAVEPASPGVRARRCIALRSTSMSSSRTATRSRRGSSSPPTARVRRSGKAPASPRTAGATASRRSSPLSGTNATMAAAPRSIFCRQGRSRSCRSRSGARRSYGRKRRVKQSASWRCPMPAFVPSSSADSSCISARSRPSARGGSHPLGFSVARSFVADRIALVGDAAHVIHPIAGQGLNMGLKDVAALAEVIVDAARLGLDPGAPDVLERYQRWRRFDTMSMGLATDGLNRLFSNQSAVLRLARDIGLGLVDRVPNLKRLFMREAAGLVGDVPKLLRGEAL